MAGNTSRDAMDGVDPAVANDTGKQHEDIEIRDASDTGSFTDLARRPRPDEGKRSHHETTFTIQEAIPDQEALKLIELQHIVKSQNETVIRVEEENTRLRKALEAYENGSKSSKKRKLEEDTDNQERAYLKKQIENLSERLNEREHELHAAWEKLAESEWKEQPSQKSIPISTSSVENILGSIQESLDARFKLLQDTLTAAIDEKIEKKNKNESARCSYTDTVTSVEPAWTSVEPSTKQEEVIRFREIVHAAKMEDIHEENEKKNRENNVIIHGKPEETEEEDKAFLQELIKELCIGAVHPRTLVRIGTKTDERNRPIKVIFNSIQDKNKLMNNLRYLKGKDLYKKVSITHDYTINERQLLQQKLQEAKEKNESDPPQDKEYKWQVRGSPKNKLFLKKVKKNHPLA